MDLWAIPGVTDSGSIVPTNYVSAPTIDTPSYLIAPSPGYGVMDIPTFTAVPDQSGGRGVLLGVRGLDCQRTEERDEQH